MDLRTLLKLKAASGGSLTEDTATGNPLTFTTDIAKPLKKLAIPFDSEDGITALNICRTGKNLFDKTVTPIEGYITGDSIAGWNVTKTVYCKCSPGTKYTVSKIVSARFFIGYTTGVPAVGSDVYGVVYDNTASSLTITTGADAEYLVIFCYHGSSDTDTFETIVNSVQVEIGETATTYEAYAGETVQVAFGETANKGELDATTGTLTVTSPAEKTVQLTPVSMAAAVGTNVIWTDTSGTNTVKYLKKNG